LDCQRHYRVLSLMSWLSIAVVDRLVRCVESEAMLERFAAIFPAFEKEDEQKIDRCTNTWTKTKLFTIKG